MNCLEFRRRSLVDPLNAAADLLVDKLLRMIDGESVDCELLPPALVVRGSCGGRDS